MKFSTQEDVKVPIDEVFENLRDFRTFERHAMRRGAEVQRVDDKQELVQGAHWKVSFDMRGRQRILDIWLDYFETQHEMRFTIKSTNIDGRFDIELLPMSRTRTRIFIALDVRPKTLSARLMIQSLRLAKNSLNKRFNMRVEYYCRALEEQYRQTA